MDDVERIREALAGVQTSSRERRRPGSTPWLVKTHVGWVRQVPTIDLSLLGGARLARRLVREVQRLTGDLDTGAVAFITGSGSAGPHSAVGTAVREELTKICGEREAWTFVATSHTQYTFIYDATRAPIAATNELGTLYYLLAGGFGLAVVLAVLQMLGVFG